MIFIRTLLQSFVDFFRNKISPKGHVLFFGHCYYNTWYLSLGLRNRGWVADTLSMDDNPANQLYYHGEHVKLRYDGFFSKFFHLGFYLFAVFYYDIIHFSGAHSIGMLHSWDRWIRNIKRNRWEIHLLKKLGVKIVYSNNGCLDGVSQSSFSGWGPINTCLLCKWKNVPKVCSDEKNLEWGKFRNTVSDYQITLGGNRKDFNDDPLVHEVPEFYCLDPDFWKPDLQIPKEHQLQTPCIKIYHAVGNYDSRTDPKTQKNVKCTHIYIPLIKKLKNEGIPVELVFKQDVPNKIIRYYQAQSDIIVDMLTFGFFGANIREGLMLGKPCVCYLRPEWLELMKKEVPEYVNELPVISATPETIEGVLRELVASPDKRKKIGKMSRTFAIKWHSHQAAALRLEKIYQHLSK